MRVFEVIQCPKQKDKAKRTVAPKTDWEKNAAQLRSKELKLNAKSPVAPVKHRP
jgi:hypothetical protein